jgi:hypothetical protein
LAEAAGCEEFDASSAHPFAREFSMPAHSLPHVGQLRRFLCRAIAAAGLIAALAAPSWAARPTAMKLFPEDTLLFLRMRNAKEFAEHVRDSSTGRMARDPQIAPLLEDLYGKASELYAEKAQSVLGISWDDLQKLPQGEVAFGIVARADATPAFLLLVDSGEEGTATRKLLDRGLEVIAEKGAEFSSEKIGDVEVTVARDPERADRQFGVFERENTIVVATDPSVLRNVLWHWDNAEDRESASAPAAVEAASTADNSTDANTHGSPAAEFVPTRTFAENHKFSTIVRQCRREQDPPPGLVFFADPIGIFREFSRGSTGAQVALGFLPMLGLDGIQAIGGTITAAVPPFEDLQHYHILLDNPRSGVLQLLTFESGDNTPQPFVPQAIENYFTGRWNAPQFYDRLRELIDKLLGAGTFDKQFAEKASKAFESDFRADIIGNLAGRVTLVSAYEKPAHIRSQKYTLIAELVDEARATETLKRIVAAHADNFEERRFGSVTYYAITPEWWRRLEEDQRPFNAFVGIMDGNVFLGGSCTLFEQFIAARDGTIARLADSEDYARVTATLGRETSGLTPIMFMLSRPEESMRHLYDLVTSEKTRQFIEENAEQHPVLAKFAEALKDHQLPPFETIMQYYGPGGGILYDTDTGYHGIAFTLRNEAGP